MLNIRRIDFPILDTVRTNVKNERNPLEHAETRYLPRILQGNEYTPRTSHIMQQAIAQHAAAQQTISQRATPIYSHISTISKEKTLTSEPQDEPKNQYPSYPLSKIETTAISMLIK